MKFRQEFDVNDRIARVWAFFEQLERVATCIPGVESVQVLDPDTLLVRATQKVGPISATLESKVHINERVFQERLHFSSTGKAVRGAVGNFRATNTVLLESLGDRTRVAVEGEVVLAGMLGSVGQKIIMKQADKVTAEFAQNLEQVLSGGSLATGSAGSRASASAPSRLPPASGRSAGSSSNLIQGGDSWSKASAVFSALSFVLSLVILWRIGVQP
ncbi:CoxG family protein [Hyphomicrobium sp. 99]|uniref:CoxG family protein n=1 Tax=Hyphomicrobium sp. 99 TaxID=1163419 RepID=UPI0005F779A6|nr:SRPBCC domain-containing protein [Hyphomicrobium sp. 99]